MALVAQAAQDTSASQTWCLANKTCQRLIGNEEIILYHVLIIRPSHHLGSALIRYITGLKVPHCPIAVRSSSLAYMLSCIEGA